MGAVRPSEQGTRRSKILARTLIFHLTGMIEFPPVMAAYVSVGSGVALAFYWACDTNRGL
jgi:hypothetical protein